MFIYMKAILSGDIIHSSALKGEGAWLKVLKEIFSGIETKFDVLGSGAQIFRGDGFQLGLENPEDALLVAILIRAGLKSDELKLEARIAIGLGEIDFLKPNILESDGEVFRLSGRLLDQLKKEKTRLALDSPYPDLNAEMSVSLKFLGLVLDNWSQADAETAWLSWLEELTPKQIEQRLNISQPAVSKRKSSARLEEISLLVERFKTLVKSYE